MEQTTLLARVTYPDNTVEEKRLSIREGVCALSPEELHRTPARVELFHPAFTGQAGDPGYFIIPNISRYVDNEPAAQIHFRQRQDTAQVFPASTMCLFAVCDGTSSLLAVCEGMQHEYELVAEVTDGAYRLYPRFRLEDAGFYEPIRFRFLPVADSDWCAIARRYRQYQLDRGACRTLARRAAENPVLKTAVEGIEFRCRLANKIGWPDVPKEQTPENEPDLEIRVTFDRLIQVMEALKAEGCENAHFCLVGWACGGMDGRDPDYFPVEQRLGGEEGLRRVLARAKELGYLVGAHTNHMIAFTRSETLDQNDLIQNPDGSGFIWGVSLGGNCHILCDKQSWEKYVPETQAKLKELGFRGMNYFDQLTIFKPRTCYHPDHPMNKKEVIDYRRKILECGRAAVGGSASEGGFDFCVDALDYAMYPVMTWQYKLPDICDNTIPFWYIVYHGILLYNAFAKTVNAQLKGPDYELLGVEYGARPLGYLHGRVFEYEGEPNFTCTTDEEMWKNARLFGEGYRRYHKLADLQYAFFEEHRILTPGVVYTRYSNGTEILINYLEEDYIWNGRRVPAKDYLRIDKA